MSFLHRPAHNSAPQVDPDVAAIESMRRAGADPSVPHPTRHFLYVPAVKAAQHVARSLRGPNRSIEIETSARNGYWLVVVSQPMLVTPESIASARVEFETAAHSVGGTYDRWQVDLAAA